MAPSDRLPVGDIIYQSLRIPVVGFRRLLWDAGFFLTANYFLMVLLTLFGTVRFAGRGWPLLVGLFIMVTYGLTASYFAVGWHRTVMSDGTAPRQPFLPRFEKEHFRYLLWVFCFVVLVFLAELILSYVAGRVLAGLHIDLRWVGRNTAASWLFASLFGLIFNSILIALLGRFLLVLPIVATGGESPFRTADALFEGRWFPVTLVLVGVLALGILLKLGLGLITLVLSAFGPLMTIWVWFEFLLGPLIFVVYISIALNATTLLYRHLLALDGAGKTNASPPS